MARPQKLGLDYFPVDVDIFEDDKLFDIQLEYGPLGEIVYLRLLCLIYKNGYYYKFDSLEKLANMLIKSIGNKWARDRQTVVQVIPFLAKCNLFSSELMQENVLTSVSIQRRYLKATERRQSIDDKEYWLLDDSLNIVPETQVNVDNNGVNVDNNLINVDNKYTKERKVKESKVKESKGECIGSHTFDLSVMFPCLEQNDLPRYGELTYKQLAEKVEESTFLKDTLKSLKALHRLADRILLDEFKDFKKKETELEHQKGMLKQNYDMNNLALLYDINLEDI